ncbi:hypothetical protein OIU85_029228 [Salix viminalis]|uniref:DYW domain-containing protein n=1 Tax=Salix viminalis TaxID=40686 RepID=A0A9Q0T6K4_SALVM|nr:hypothetical protein OIU85_029228 [Salix viminalis]
MYLSCGTLDYATRVFESIDEPEAMAWTVIRVWSQRAAIFGDDECEHGAVPTADHYDFMKLYQIVSQERKEQPLFRNLRACEDCHDFGRESEIIVRDSADSITSRQGNVLAMTTGDPTQRCITEDSFVS